MKKSIFAAASVAVIAAGSAYGYHYHKAHSWRVVQKDDCIHVTVDKVQRDVESTPQFTDVTATVSNTCSTSQEAKLIFGVYRTDDTNLDHLLGTNSPLEFGVLAPGGSKSDTSTLILDEKVWGLSNASFTLKSFLNAKGV